MLTFIVHTSFLSFTHALQEAKEGRTPQRFHVSCQSKAVILSVIAIDIEMQRKTPRREWVFRDEAENERETMPPPPGYFDP